MIHNATLCLERPVNRRSGVGILLVGMLAWGLPLQQAVELPNLIARGGEFYGEVARFPQPVLEALAARGVTVKAGRGEESGLHGVAVREGGRLEGAADPRREGVWQAINR